MDLNLKTTIKTRLIIITMSSVVTGSAFAQSWTLTPQSDVGFEIKSMGLTVLKAKFNQVQSTMQFDAKAPQNASTHFVLDVDSLSFIAKFLIIYHNRSYGILNRF